MTPEPSYREITLTKGQVAKVSSEDFENLSKWKWFSISCTDAHVYAARYVWNKGDSYVVLMHREIFPEAQYIDHANHDTLDNRRENLRPCSQSQNQGNRVINKDNKSGYKGVCWNKEKRKWEAKCKRRHLGRFDSPEEAARAYDASAIKHFGEFAHINFPL